MVTDRDRILQPKQSGAPMAIPDIDDLPESLRNALDITVGLGLLGFQRAQVQRRSLERRLEQVEPDLPDPARSVSRQFRALSATIGDGLAELLVSGSSRSPSSAAPSRAQEPSAPPPATTTDPTED